MVTWRGSTSLTERETFSLRRTQFGLDVLTRNFVCKQGTKMPYVGSSDQSILGGGRGYKAMFLKDSTENGAEGLALEVEMTFTGLTAGGDGTSQLPKIVPNFERKSATVKAEQYWIGIYTDGTPREYKWVPGTLTFDYRSPTSKATYVRLKRPADNQPQYPPTNAVSAIKALRCTFKPDSDPVHWPTETPDNVEKTVFRNVRAKAHWELESFEREPNGNWFECEESWAVEMTETDGDGVDIIITIDPPAPGGT